MISEGSFGSSLMMNQTVDLHFDAAMATDAAKLQRSFKSRGKKHISVHVPPTIKFGWDVKRFGQLG